MDVSCYPWSSVALLVGICLFIYGAMWTLFVLLRILPIFLTPIRDNSSCFLKNCCYLCSPPFCIFAPFMELLFLYAEWLSNGWCWCRFFIWRAVCNRARRNVSAISIWLVVYERYVTEVSKTIRFHHPPHSDWQIMTHLIIKCVLKMVFHTFISVIKCVFYFIFSIKLTRFCYHPKPWLVGWHTAIHQTTKTNTKWNKL